MTTVKRPCGRIRRWYHRNLRCTDLKILGPPVADHCRNEALSLTEARRVREAFWELHFTQPAGRPWRCECGSHAAARLRELDYRAAAALVDPR